MTAPQSKTEDTCCGGCCCGPAEKVELIVPAEITPPSAKEDKQIKIEGACCGDCHCSAEEPKVTVGAAAHPAVVPAEDNATNPEMACTHGCCGPEEKTHKPAMGCSDGCCCGEGDEIVIPSLQALQCLIRMPTKTEAEKVSTMTEVREAIDCLDRQIVRLLSTRLSYIEAAARIKPVQAAVRDNDRKADVIEKAVKTATEQGLSTRIVEKVYECLVEECIRHEHIKWQEIRGIEVDLEKVEKEY